MAHGKNNRQSKGHVKVKRKTRNLRRFKTKFVGDASIKKIWDNSKTTKQNYDVLGLVDNPNLIAHNSKHKVSEDDDVELFDVPDSDILNDRNPKKANNHMSEEEIKYLRKQIVKHGENYEKMARDIKTNNMQWTLAKLKRRCARLHLLDANVL